MPAIQRCPEPDLERRHLANAYDAAGCTDLGQRVQRPGLFLTLAATIGTDTDRYVHGPMGLLAQQDAASNWEYPLTDGLGSVRGVLDSSAAPLESRHYSPYGEPISATGASQTPFGLS
jgi:hypothetical protein